jgi:hypothetical protein
MAVGLINFAANHMVELALDQVLGEFVGAAPGWPTCICGAPSIQLESIAAT